jgi:hypothetical protein
MLVTVVVDVRRQAYGHKKSATRCEKSHIRGLATLMDGWGCKCSKAGEPMICYLLNPVSGAISYMINRLLVEEHIRGSVERR